MPALTPSTNLKNKTNVKPVGNRLQEATAEDFQELGNILDNHAALIDALDNVSSLNPNYGIYTSLALLQAAHPVGELNAYATIDAGPGITPQIAIWDEIDEEWEISGYSDNTIEVANYAALPASGTTGKWYITLNTNYLYRWYNSQYNLVGVPATYEVLIQGAIVQTAGKTNLTTLEVGDKFRYWDGDTCLFGKIISTPALIPTDLYNDTIIKLALNGSI